MKAGEKIKQIRELKGYSQEYMAMRLDMSQNNYSPIEAEEVKLTLDRLSQIAEILDVNPLDILSFDKDLVFNNHNQKGGQAGNIVIQMLTEQERELYLRQIAHLEEEIRFLRNMLDKGEGKG